ncbi:MAG: DNA polymerase III subunit gamma/tau, partial [Ginsengibacter sp.]
KRITNNDTVEHLEEICVKEGVKAEKTALHLIAQKSEGCLRDSLSIFDKIVSFTNAELTYANTLEHLNILDEDYYFKLIDAMQNQSVSDAILLFDEINSKGFEGDLVLNGFAEFLRNLLVSKDKKVVALLEVSEGFKKRYVETAAKVDSAWLLSAMNIVSDSEINFRQTKNKRLHVELTLIKLCYLHQALELTDSGNGASSKKKLIDGVKPVSFRALTPVVDKAKRIQPSSKIKEKDAIAPKEENNQNQQIEGEPKTSPSKSEKEELAPGKLTIEEPKTKFNTTFYSLEKIREKVARENQNNKKVELEEEELYIAWGKYMEELTQNKNHSTVSIFKQAKLNIIDENCIEIITENSLQQKFIESERGALITHLQAHFNNRFLTYQVIVIKNKNKAQIKPEHLSTKEQYLKIIEKYPLVKQMKDRLGLQLDY